MLIKILMMWHCIRAIYLAMINLYIFSRFIVLYKMFITSLSYSFIRTGIKLPHWPHHTIKLHTFTKYFNSSTYIVKNHFRRKCVAIFVRKSNTIRKIRMSHYTPRTHWLRPSVSRVLASSNLKDPAWRTSTRELSHIVSHAIFFIQSGAQVKNIVLNIIL